MEANAYKISELTIAQQSHSTCLEFVTHIQRKTPFSGASNVVHFSLETSIAGDAAR